LRAEAEEGCERIMTTLDDRIAHLETRVTMPRPGHGGRACRCPLTSDLPFTRRFDARRGGGEIGPESETAGRQ
jgi:hypothetical protein